MDVLSGRAAIKTPPIAVSIFPCEPLEALPASASLRPSRDVSPFCRPVLHPMDRAWAGVSRVRRVVMRAQLLGGSLSKNIGFPRGSDCVRLPPLRASCVNPSERSHQPGHSPRQQTCIRLAIERFGCAALGTTMLAKLRQLLVIARKAERVRWHKDAAGLKHRLDRLEHKDGEPL